MTKYLFIAVLLFSVVELNAQTDLSEDTLHWHSSRPLNWDDFNGEVIEDIGRSGEAICMNLASFKKPNLFQKTKFEVLAIFDRKQSWVVDEMKNNDGLTYFQIMFNIYEVHARKLRKDLSETKFGLDPNSIFQEKYHHSMSELMNDFNAFRRETKMGQEEEAVSRWKVKVEEELESLKQYR
jgi:hypothetical protein